ncbi:hypothetical protein BCR37DRAFT_394687 [Protomyces lactucae-debilis]|uniref:Uncharacterized protein n=1 Tax=Protomyces lactucae-debilis TaxID=2754530 RepID=A0A1Y2F5H3_PROLT|nr:uncharacterized protein BCR37DRAFT_394687 [Protomyces lactucae-debilis]ORY78185.1 hypothetical protein BCR37DRAFT_394687 [Protomyces lactucae-debilis]
MRSVVTAAFFSGLFSLATAISLLSGILDCSYEMTAVWERAITASSEETCHWYCDAKLTNASLQDTAAFVVRRDKAAGLIQAAISTDGFDACLVEKSDICKQNTWAFQKIKEKGPNCVCYALLKFMRVEKGTAKTAKGKVVNCDIDAFAKRVADAGVDLSQGYLQTNGGPCKGSKRSAKCDTNGQLVANHLRDFNEHMDNLPSKRFLEKAA